MCESSGFVVVLMFEAPQIETEISMISYVENIYIQPLGARCSSVVRAFAHDTMGCRIDSSWDGPIELFLVPASAPRLV